MPEKTKIVQILTQKFYSDSPDGLREATMPGWSGRIILGPRGRLKDALSLMNPQPESTEVTPIPGVYFLTKKTPQALYIGQSRALSTRLRNHVSNRPDWKQFVIAPCTDTYPPMDIADIGYLEWKLIEHARSTKQITLENPNNPSPPRISEEKKFQLDLWLVGILRISSLLGMKYFIGKAQQDTSSVDDPPTVFEMNCRAGQARAMNGYGNFVVLENSSAIGEWRAKSGASEHARKLLLELQNDGTLVQNTNDKFYRFTRDCEFNSPSLAAAIIVGTPESGPRRWKVEGTDTTYKEWQSGESE